MSSPPPPAWRETLAGLALGAALVGGVVLGGALVTAGYTVAGTIALLLCCIALVL